MRKLQYSESILNVKHWPYIPQTEFWTFVQTLCVKFRNFMAWSRNMIVPSRPQVCLTFWVEIVSYVSIATANYDA